MPSKFKKNAQTPPKLPQKNIEKIPKTTFLSPKLSKQGCQLWQKGHFLGPFLRFKLKYCLFGDEKKIKVVPLIAKGIYFFFK